ncbi:hypothetical protein YC2023_035976 [Brassica napus]
MLEDFPQSLQEVFRSLLPKVKTLGRLSEDFLGSLLMHFMLEDVPQSLQEVFQSFLLKVTLEDFSEDSWTLGRLLEDFSRSLLMYFMPEDVPQSLREVFRSLLPKVVQRNDVKWSPCLSMLKNDI